MVGESSVTSFVLLVKHKVNEIESGQQGWRKFNVVDDRHLWIILRVDWIGSSQDCCSSIQRTDDSSLGNRDSLLLHGLMKNYSGVVVHLIELINAADTSIREN